MQQEDERADNLERGLEVSYEQGCVQQDEPTDILLREIGEFCGQRGKEKMRSTRNKRNV
jgi:hypothetical protein